MNTNRAVCLEFGFRLRALAGLALLLCWLAPALGQPASFEGRGKTPPKSPATDPSATSKWTPIVPTQGNSPAPELKTPYAPAREPQPIPPVLAAAPTLTLEQAVLFALTNNPQLASIRQQHGIAAASMVIAKTYPYNPISQSNVWGVWGPQTAGITNPVYNQHKLTIDVEVRGQRQFRQQVAFAALTRTDWEIATQEVTMAVNTVRAFDALLHRQAKMALSEELLKLNQEAAAQIKILSDGGQLRPADAILARADAQDPQAIVLNSTALVTARRDLARALGGTDLTAVLSGTLNRPAPDFVGDQILELALEHRPELFARKAAIAEAEARLKLQIADRWGNPNIGPVYERNETSANFSGIQIGGPIPVFNRRQGEIKQREAERVQAILNLRQVETEIRQDAAAAGMRVTETRKWVERYRKEILPALQKGLDEMQSLFKSGQENKLRVLDMRRKLLRAQDGYLDALLAYTQALADMAQAAGDPAIAISLYQPTGTTPESKSP
jgi:outer membrane protein, heavy metal efflux system